MRIAIPTFGTRISPRFDCAARLVIVEIQGGSILDRQEESMELLHWRHRLGLLTRKQVDLLLCGGIRRRDCFSLINTGIDVCTGLMGEVDDILEAFLRGEIAGMNPGDRLRMNFEKKGKGWRRGRGGRSGMGIKG